MLGLHIFRRPFPIIALLALFVYASPGQTQDQSERQPFDNEVEVRAAMRQFTGKGLAEFFAYLQQMRRAPAEDSARAALLHRVKNLAVNSKELDPMLIRQWQAALAPVFKLHQREGQFEVIIFPDDEPFVRTYAEAIILISTRSVQLAASRAGLAGLVAHEIAHEYLTSLELLAPLESGLRRQREIELVCDGIAAATLIKLGMNPEDYARALANHLAASGELARLKQRRFHLSIAFGQNRDDPACARTVHTR